MKRGLKSAIEYLLQYPGVALVPDDICLYANLDIMSHTLSHSLRRATRDGKVIVEYKKDNTGQNIAHYKANLDYRAPAKALEASPVYFYSVPDSKIPSPYFSSIQAVKSYAYATNAGLNDRFWTGSHEAPIPVEE